VLQQDELVLLSMTIDDREAIHMVLPLYGQHASKDVTLILLVFVLIISIVFSPFLLK